MKMTPTLHIALNDLRLHLSDRSNVFFLFLLPVLFILFFGAVFKGGGGPERINISLPVVNGDGQFLSMAYVEALKGQNFRVDEFTPQAAADTTFGTRVATIPAGLTDSVLAHRKIDIQLTKRADSNASFDFAAEARMHQAQVGFLGSLARWLPLQPVAASQIDDADKGRFFAMIAEPPIVAVQPSFAGRGRPVPSGMGQSVPGMLAMFIVMTVVIGGSAALTEEKASGTLTRLATTPASRREILAGKVIGLTLLGLAQAAILMLAAEIMGRAHVLGITFTWGRAALPVALLLVPYSVCIACIALLAGGLLRTTQQAESLAWLVGMVMAALGGCWWPLEIVPPWLRGLGHLFPTAWAMDGFHSMITFGQSITALALPIGALLVMAAVTGYLGARSMRVMG